MSDQNGNDPSNTPDPTPDPIDDQMYEQLGDAMGTWAVMKTQLDRIIRMESQIDAALVERLGDNHPFLAMEDFVNFMAASHSFDTAIKRLVLYAKNLGMDMPRLAKTSIEVVHQLLPTGIGVVVIGDSPSSPPDSDDGLTYH